MSGLFENPGNSVKALAKFCFYVCLLIAVAMFVWGVIRILSVVDSNTTLGEVLAYTAEDYAYGLAKNRDRYVDGYMGKKLCLIAICVALASLATIPLYAFGCLVEDTESIAYAIVHSSDLPAKNSNDDKLLAVGGWKCTCGRVNAAYTSTCACGTNRRDISSAK